MTRWCVAILAGALMMSPAFAGDRPLELLIVNMTPDGSVTDASRSCLSNMIRTIRSRRQGWDDVNIMRLGETALLSETGRSDPRNFLEWPASALAPVQDRERGARRDRLDAVALIDCQPEAERLDVLVVSPARGAARMRVRGSISRAKAQWAGERILDHGWVGFSP